MQQVDFSDVEPGFPCYTLLLEEPTQEEQQPNPEKRPYSHMESQVDFGDIDPEFMWAVLFGYKRQILRNLVIDEYLDQCIEWHISKEEFRDLLHSPGLIERAKYWARQATQEIFLERDPHYEKELWRDFLYQSIWDRDQGICWVCGQWFPEESCRKGHIVERYVGGFMVPENLANMCEYCNIYIKPTHFCLKDAYEWRRFGYEQYWAEGMEFVHTHADARLKAYIDGLSAYQYLHISQLCKSDPGFSRR